MKKHPILYIKSYGFRLWFIQMTILILNYLKVFNNLKNMLVVRKNKMVLTKITKQYKELIGQYKNLKFKKINSNKVWVYWYQGKENMPELVRTCINSMKKNLKKTEIVLITKDNLSKYVDVDKNILKKYKDGKIGNAHFSDIIRIALLKEYGGIWLDATILVTEKIENIGEMKTIKFHCEEKTSISQGMWCCFFLGNINPKLYYFLNDFYKEYWTKENIIIDYFLLDIIIKIAYNEFLEVKKDLDSNKYNNEQIHKLCNKLNLKYVKEDMKDLLKKNKIHKLSFKMNLIDHIDDDKTYWGYIREEYSNEK